MASPRLVPGEPPPPPTPSLPDADALALEAKARLAAIVESSDDAIVSKTLDGIITSWNLAAERMFGWTQAEVVGRHVSLIIPTERLAEEDHIIRSIRRGERVETFETQRRTKDGRLLDISLTVSPVMTDDGRLIGASKIARDITERKRTEALLERQTEHLRLLLEASRLFAESHFDLPELMSHLMDILVPALADSGYVRRLSEDGRWIETIAVRHRDRNLEQQERTVAEERQAVGEGMTGQIIRTGRPIFMPDIDDEAFRRAIAPQHRTAVGRSGMRSYMMVPMRARGTAVGALGVGRMTGRPRFSTEDLDVVQRLADQAGLALLTWHAFQLVEREKEALARSESRFRALADNAPDIIARFDQEGRHVYVNPRIERIVGVPAARVLGHAHRELGLPPEVSQVWEARLAEAFLGREVLLDYALPTTDGVRHYQAKLVPEPGRDGRIHTVLAIARDVTELAQRVRRGEEAFTSFTAMAERLSATDDLDALLDALVVDAIQLVGAEGGCAGLRTAGGMTTTKYFQHGRAMPMAYRWPPGYGLPGWLIEHRIPYMTNDAASDPQIVPEVRARHEVRSALSIPILDAAGEPIAFFELHNKPDGFTLSDERLLLGMSHTASIAIQSALALTRARRAESEERRRSAELAEVVQELETFAYSVAHDLRAPVRAMDGYSQVLVEEHGAQLDAEGRGIAQRISESGRRVDRMIQDLLAYSRLSREDIVLQPTELGNAVRAAMDQMRPEIDALNARIEVKPPLPTVMAHPMMLGQVLSNLISNALKFVSPGVTPEVVVWAETRDGTARLWVADNGIGIAPAYHARLFRVFERLHGQGAFPGTGIGLAIVRRAVERMGGAAGLESQAGAGSRFWIELPRVVQADAASDPRVARESVE